MRGCRAGPRRRSMEGPPPLIARIAGPEGSRRTILLCCQTDRCVGRGESLLAPSVRP
jgi:hypothetical protein